jgi:hypothetical protein
MTVAYWIVAALLALLYLYSGGLKVLRSPGSAARVVRTAAIRLRVSDACQSSSVIRSGQAVCGHTL